MIKSAFLFCLKYQNYQLSLIILQNYLKALNKDAGHIQFSLSQIKELVSIPKVNSFSTKIKIKE